jgi:hypothetical protein
MPLVFKPLSQELTDHLRAGGVDANGQLPEVAVSDGTGVPCRATLRMVPKGARYLIVAHRPFETLNPYTETGPIFVSAEPSDNAVAGPALPVFFTSVTYLVRGYSVDERIVYGTGQVTPTGQIVEYCQALLARGDVAFVHIHSASNTCFHCRVERG